MQALQRLKISGNNALVIALDGKVIENVNAITVQPLGDGLFRAILSVNVEVEADVNLKNTEVDRKEDEPEADDDDAKPDDADDKRDALKFG